MNNLTSVFILMSVLAVMAHIKLYFLQSSINNVITIISDRFKVIDAKVGQIEALNVKPDQIEGAPSDAIKRQHTDRHYAMVLQTFYGLTPESRSAVFSKTAGSLHGEAFEAVWKACLGPIDRSDTSGISRYQIAADFQNALVNMNDSEFDTITQAIMVESRTSRPLPNAVSQNSHNEPIKIDHVTQGHNSNNDSENTLQGQKKHEDNVINATHEDKAFRENAELGEGSIALDVGADGPNSAASRLRDDAAPPKPKAKAKGKAPKKIVAEVSS